MTGADRWRGALRAAAQLGIAPREFWRLSISEWRALAGPDDVAAGSLSRAELDAMMKQFPDTDGPDGR